jgi:hemoglobin-like flavoprotein
MVGHTGFTVTPEQKVLVQQSFTQVLPISEQAAALFYSRLFQLDPSLRPLFRGDIKDQGRKLMQMIGFCVGKLDALDEIGPAVKDLGRRHAGYGVTQDAYLTVGAALLWTLEQGLGPYFTPDVKAAWAAVYGVLADTMQSGAAAAN